MNANLFFAKKKLDLISKMHCTILLAKTQESIGTYKKHIPEGHDPYVSWRLQKTLQSEHQRELASTSGLPPSA